MVSRLYSKINIKVKTNEFIHVSETMPLGFDKKSIKFFSCIPSRCDTIISHKLRSNNCEVVIEVYFIRLCIFKSYQRRRNWNSRHMKPFHAMCNNRNKYWCCFLNTLKVKSVICTNLENQKHNPCKVNWATKIKTKLHS